MRTHSEMLWKPALKQAWAGRVGSRVRTPIVPNDFGGFSGFCNTRTY